MHGQYLRVRCRAIASRCAGGAFVVGLTVSRNNRGPCHTHNRIWPYSLLVLERGHKSQVCQGANLRVPQARTLGQRLRSWQLTPESLGRLLSRCRREAANGWECSACDGMEPAPPPTPTRMAPRCKCRRSSSRRSSRTSRGDDRISGCHQAVFDAHRTSHGDAGRIRTQRGRKMKRRKQRQRPSAPFAMPCATTLSRKTEECQRAPPQAQATPNSTAGRMHPPEGGPARPT